MRKVSSCRTVYLVAQLESHLDMVHQIAETMGLDQGKRHPLRVAMRLALPP